jgi:hypothetical protein
LFADNARGGLKMLGRLSWAAIPFYQPLPLYAMGVVGIIILAVLGVITKKGWWPYLWREWLTSVDHKRIGVMYLILALVMLLRGYSDAIMMRSQQAIAIGGAQGYLPPDHYNQIFSSHGTIMIFLVAMPFVVGLMNFVVPLQLGSRDVAGSFSISSGRMMRTTQLYQAMVNNSSICCRGPRNDVAAQVASLMRPSSVISFASRMTERSSVLKQSTVSKARNFSSCSRRTPAFNAAFRHCDHSRQAIP